MQMRRNDAEVSDLDGKARLNGQSGLGLSILHPAASVTRAPLSRTVAGNVLLVIALVSGAVTHAYHIFIYPLYITDEGIYMERAWAVLREGALSPYTYTYDHAPAGWLAIAAWVTILPHQFQAFGAAENAGRVLMVLVHIANVYFLFEVTRRLSGSLVAAFVATFLFSFSPLAVFYQREVVLDNLMVFWVLLSLYLASNSDQRVLTPMLSGVAFGLSVLTKENAIFFIPGWAYLLYWQARAQSNRRFALGLSTFLALSVVSVYFLSAVLKNELLPEHLDFNLNVPPSGHVSLLYTIWQQLHRNQGSLLNRNSPVWQFSLGAWLPKDAFLIIAGAASTCANLVIGWRNRQQSHGALVAGLLAGGYMLYLARGSVMLEFYVVPLVPFLAMNLGMIATHLLPMAIGDSRLLKAAVLGVCCVLLLSPIGGYLLVRAPQGRFALHDLYKLDLTGMQTQELQYVRTHIPPDSRIIMDEEFWVDLHDIKPDYPYAVSHFEATGDPAIRDQLFHQDWNNVDYVVMSNKMLQTMEQDNSNGQYNWILDLLDHHAQRIWMLQHGGVELEIWQVQH